MLAVVGGCAVMPFTVSTLGRGLVYHSGDRPEEVRQAICPPGGHPICDVRTAFLAWRLSPDSVRRTDLRDERDLRLTVAGLYGELETSGCAGADVEVALTIGGVRLDPFVVGGTKRQVSSAAPLPRIIEFYQGPVSVELRRIDRKPCTATFSWRAPAVGQDEIEDGRRRLAD
ncbi:hypothetical protein [Streptomyces sp. NPDC058457]|uniref:hypothetical protein n=1 Tax=Streptomyces sp. NPDC058457 TaxID=3346507 RepID=UPI00365BB484